MAGTAIASPDRSRHRDPCDGERRAREPNRCLRAIPLVKIAHSPDLRAQQLDRAVRERDVAAFRPFPSRTRICRSAKSTSFTRMHRRSWYARRSRALRRDVYLAPEERQGGGGLVAALRSQTVFRASCARNAWMLRTHATRRRGNPAHRPARSAVRTQSSAVPAFAACAAASRRAAPGPTSCPGSIGRFRRRPARSDCRTTARRGLRARRHARRPHAPRLRGTTPRRECVSPFRTARVWPQASQADRAIPPLFSHSPPPLRRRDSGERADENPRARAMECAAGTL